MSCHPGGEEPACWEGASHFQVIFQLQIYIIPAQFRNTSTHALLLMEDILHHLGCIKPLNSGINYLSTG